MNRHPIEMLVITLFYQQGNISFISRVINYYYEVRTHSTHTGRKTDKQTVRQKMNTK